jgi:hypothetical protein
MNLLAAALNYAKQGLPVFPCNAEKKPLVAGGFKSATTDADQIKRWWSEWSGALIGMPTGKASGRIVIDSDSPEAEAAFHAMAKEDNAAPSITFRVATGRGFHYHFQEPEGVEIRNSAGELAPGVDIRGEGGYVIMPPSLHPNGKRYTVVDDSPPAQIPIWLLLRIERPKLANRSKIFAPCASRTGTEKYAPMTAELARDRFEHLLATAACAKVGQRNTAANTVAYFASRAFQAGVFERLELDRSLWGGRVHPYPAITEDELKTLMEDSVDPHVKHTIHRSWCYGERDGAITLLPALHDAAYDAQFQNAWDGEPSAAEARAYIEKRLAEFGCDAECIGVVLGLTKIEEVEAVEFYYRALLEACGTCQK